MKKISILLVIIAFIVSLSGCAKNEYTNISNDELKTFLETPAIINL
jgi:type III secretory pathway lipoprotein EscJ